MSETLKQITKTSNGLTATFIALLLAGIIGVIGLSCSSTTRSPIDPERKVNARDLNIEYQVWLAEQKVFQRKFELAAADLEIQTEQLTAIGEAISQLAAGGIPSVPGLLQLLLGAGFTGLIIDNVRKTKANINAGKNSSNS